MAINFRGYLFDDSGNAIQGATVQLLEQDGDEEASTTTDSNGLWYFNEADQDAYDIKITRGSQIRYVQWDDQVSMKEIDVRNDSAATTPALTATNLTNSTANQVAVFSGANTTRADNDEIYLSFKLANSAGDIEEFARMTAVATDVTDGNEDAQIEFDVRKSGTLTKVWTIASSDAGAMSFDMNVDALTIGSGANTDISLTFDATTYDGVITWMEDEDYFKFSDEILMNSTEKILFGDTGTFIHQSSDGVLTITSDTTVDINGAVVFDGALSGITTIASGAITSTGIVTGTGFTAGSAVLAEAELELLDGLTAGTAIASKVVTTDASIDTTGQRNLTITGTMAGVTGTFSGVLTGTTVEATADTSAGDNAAIGYTSAEGLILTGQGSTSDITIKNDADATVLSVATGTTTATFAGTVLAKTDTDTSNTGSVTLDFTANQNFVLTLTGNTTLVNPSTEIVGQSGFIAFIQDGTGGRTITLGTDYETAGSAGLSLTSTAAATDLVPYVCVAASRILLGTPQLAFG